MDFDSLAFGKGSEGSDYSVEAYAAHDRNASEDWNMEKEMAQDPFVTVSVVTPFTVLDGSDSWFEMTGFKRQHMLGRTLRMLQGPATDVERLKDLITGSRNGAAEHQASLLTFYLSSGEEFVCGVHAVKADAIDGKDACTLYMHYSDAIPLKALQDNTKTDASLLLSCQGGNIIETVSPAFCSMFSYLEQQVRGRSINLIHSPATDKKAWTGLIQGAQRGITRKATLIFSDSQCTSVACQVSALPILSDCGGAVNKLMMVFTKDQGESPCCTEGAAVAQQPGAQQVPQRDSQQPSLFRAPSIQRSTSASTSSSTSCAGILTAKARSSPDMGADRAFMTPRSDLMREGSCVTVSPDDRNIRKKSAMDKATMRHIMAMQKRGQQSRSSAQMGSALTAGTPSTFSIAENVPSTTVDGNSPKAADSAKDGVCTTALVEERSGRDTVDCNGQPAEKAPYTSSLMGQVKKTCIV
jgi:hypothetical protein